MKIKYRDLLEKDITTILDISSVQFGHDYLKTDTVLKYLSNPKTYIPVIEYEEKIIGYSIIHMFNKDELVQHLGLNNSSQIEDISSNSIIQFRKTTAIHPNFAGKGFGNNFVRYTMSMYSADCDFIVSLNWKRKAEIPMAKISIKNGMNILAEIPDYWCKASLKSRIICPECGAPPCKCSAIIYIKKLQIK